MTTSPPKSFRRGIDWKNWWVIGRDSTASVSMSNGEYVFVGRAGMRMKWKSWIIIRRPRIYLRIVTIAMHERISGVAGAYPRSIYRGSGYTDEELQRPLIGVGTAYFEGHPAARALEEQAKAVKAASGWPEGLQSSSIPLRFAMPWPGDRA